MSLPIRNLCVFCGSNPGTRPHYLAAARALGSLLAARDWGLVYGGGKVGLMGAVADAVLASGGRVIGVIPEALRALELAHLGLTQLHVVATMHERKALMAQLADGFIALPGGYGTFEEVLEVLTWTQLGFHTKPVGLLNVAGYYDPLLAQLDRAAEEGFMPAAHRELALSATDPAALADQLLNFTPPSTPKWLTPPKGSTTPDTAPVE